MSKEIELDIVHYVVDGDYGTGWYFWNEVWVDRYGPYDTKAECEKELQQYADKYLIMTQNEIKPCPFCSSTDIRYSLKITGRYDIRYHATMYCNKCHCYGPRVLTEKTKYADYDGRRAIKEDKSIEQLAITAWNKREPRSKETI